ncbi:MAG TPA: 4Fe-4S binding protein [Acidobacteriota bacterium]|nr:4Fe-4S binding protein [Acidobacteriota bacterium]HRV07630.1 4Fe-4S binding protein [Acidobacteriota bacterium]
MWLVGKLRELFWGWRPGVVTLRYPLEPRPTPTGFRGRPKWDHHKCVGCGGCADHCSARAILVRDLCQELRVLLYDGSRCTYCGRCADLCPEKAITMTQRFEEATNDRVDLTERVELYMMTCRRCGRCFDLEITNALDRLSLRGYRYDNLEYRAVIPMATPSLSVDLLRRTERYQRPESLEIRGLSQEEDWGR